MTPERALEIVQRLVVKDAIERGLPASKVTDAELAYQTLHGALSRVDGLAALYHEGIERLGSHVDVRG